MEQLNEMKNLLEEHKDYLEMDGYPILNEKKKRYVARLLDNYLKERASFNEQTVTGDVSGYDPVLLPVIRRGIPQLIGMEIFGTQPMTAPTGLLFCIRAVFQNTTAAPVKRSNSKLLVLADNGDQFTEGTLITSDGAGAGRGTVRYREGNSLLVEVTSGTYAVGDSVDDAYPFVGAVTTVSAVYDNEMMYRLLFAEYARFENVAAAEQASTTIREAGIVIDKITATAVSHKLKVKYTDELQQDMRALHNMDAETELVKVISDELVTEQNKTFINELITQAKLGGTTTWDHQSLYYGGDADGRWSVEKAYSFYEYINKIANNIAKTTLRGRGNFIVASLDVISVLEVLRHWRSTSISEGIVDVNLGTSAFCGVLGGKYKVFCDLYAEEDYCVIGYKGPNEWDAGIYYGPYVPFYAKKGIGEEDGQPRLFFHTRYAVTSNPFGAELYYRYITVNL